MSIIDEKEKEQSKVDKAKEVEKSEFRLGILPLDPLFVLIALIYGITRSESLRFENVSINIFFFFFPRILEFSLGTERFWEKLWISSVEFVGKKVQKS